MKRVNYGVINAKYKQIGKGNVRLTQSSLFLRKPINPTVTSYSFDVLETQTATLQNDEIRLNINDEFIVTQMGLYLTGIISRTVEGNTTQYSGLNLYTHALQNLDFIKGQSLISFYDGALKIAVNNIVYLEKWDTRKHYIAPTTQYGNQASGVQATLPSNEFGKDGMYSVEPMITLSGAKKNDLSLTLPQALTAQKFSYVDSQNTLIDLEVTGIALLLRGLNAQNAASFQ